METKSEETLCRKKRKTTTTTRSRRSSSRCVKKIDALIQSDEKGGRGRGKICVCFIVCVCGVCVCACVSVCELVSIRTYPPKRGTRKHTAHNYSKLNIEK